MEHAILNIRGDIRIHFPDDGESKLDLTATGAGRRSGGRKGHSPMPGQMTMEDIFRMRSTEKVPGEEKNREGI